MLGPNANRSAALVGNYDGCSKCPGCATEPDCHLVNVLEGIAAGAKQISNGTVTFAQGVEIDSQDASGIPEAVRVAKAADVAVVVLGLKTCQESGDQCQEAEAKDRHHIGLPGLQGQLLDAVLAVQKNTIVVLLNGGAVSGAFYANAPAVLEAFYPGVLGGAAVADVLFGDVSPAGRLPYTIVQSMEDLPPDYYSMDMAQAPGRTHRYFTREPGFAFGFGLSYTTFAYRSTKASGNVSSGMRITGSVANTGGFYSDEVVLCFVRPQHIATGMPNIGLVGFTRLHSVPPGGVSDFELVLSPRALASAGVKDGQLLKLYVGGRAPGSMGAWADPLTTPAEPLEVSVSLPTIVV